MISNGFRFSSPYISVNTINSFVAASYEKENFSEIVNEWNTRESISSLSLKWKKRKTCRSK